MNKKQRWNTDPRKPEEDEVSVPLEDKNDDPYAAVYKTLWGVLNSPDVGAKIDVLMKAMYSCDAIRFPACNSQDEAEDFKTAAPMGNYMCSKQCLECHLSNILPTRLLILLESGAAKFDWAALTQNTEVYVVNPGLKGSMLDITPAHYFGEVPITQDDGSVHMYPAVYPNGKSRHTYSKAEDGDPVTEFMGLIIRSKKNTPIVKGLIEAVALNASPRTLETIRVSTQGIRLIQPRVIPYTPKDVEVSDTQETSITSQSETQCSEQSSSSPKNEDNQSSGSQREATQA